MTSTELAAAIDAAGDPEDAVFLRRYFKTGPGEYGEGDVFVGVRVPAVRVLVRQSRSMPVDQAFELLGSAVHEHRLAALLVLVERFVSASRPRTRDEALRAELHARYLVAVSRAQVNNWDLVDSSAEVLVGAWLPDHPSSRSVSWIGLPGPRTVGAPGGDHRDVRLHQGRPRRAGTACRRLLLGDREPLIHKASGWMLREVGKRVSREALTEFLSVHAARMPRTMLSYAIEHLTDQERSAFRALRP